MERLAQRSSETNQQSGKQQGKLCSKACFQKVFLRPDRRRWPVLWAWARSLLEHVQMMAVLSKSCLLFVCASVFFSWEEILYICHIGNRRADHLRPLLIVFYCKMIAAAAHLRVCSPLWRTELNLDSEWVLLDMWPPDTEYGCRTGKNRLVQPVTCTHSSHPLLFASLDHGIDATLRGMETGLRTTAERSAWTADFTVASTLQKPRPQSQFVGGLKLLLMVMSRDGPIQVIVLPVLSHRHSWVLIQHLQEDF